MFKTACVNKRGSITHQKCLLFRVNLLLTEKIGVKIVHTVVHGHAFYLFPLFINMNSIKSGFPTSIYHQLSLVISSVSCENLFQQIPFPYEFTS